MKRPEERGVSGVPANPRPKQEPVLDPVERVSECIYGVLMAVTFTGSLSVASSGREERATMLAAAIGCNLAWGITDAVMFLVDAATERHRRIALLHRVQAAQDPHEAHRVIAKALPDLAENAEAVDLEALRKRLLAVPLPASSLGLRDFAGAVSVFALVVFATFLVVIPFLIIQDTRLALRVSNGLALAALLTGGFILGRYAGGPPWKYALGLGTIGTVLIAIIIALGG